jgi:hypothetical protein
MQAILRRQFLSAPALAGCFIVILRTPLVGFLDQHPSLSYTRIPLPTSDEATPSGIQAQGYVSNVEIVSGVKPTLTAYIYFSGA